MAETKTQPKSFYLLSGDEFLIRRAADELVAQLLPAASVGLNLFTLDGGSPREVAAELSTLPLFPGAKLVLVREPEFLAPKKGRGDVLSKAKEAWKAGRRKEGARRLLALVARAGWGVGEIDPSASGAPSTEQWKDELDVDLAPADLPFLQEVATFCREENVRAPEGDVGPLVELIERGLPDGHVLLLLASDVDAKNPLLKLAKERGALIERKVADRLKDLDVAALSKEVLAPFRKSLGRGVEELLKERIGANMRLWQSELEKLALHASGPTIELADVELLVAHAREEEFLELSDALHKRDLQAALRYVREASEQGVHGLQLLGAVASILRTLLQNRERLSKKVQGPFRMSFNDFKAQLFPEIEAEAKARKARVPHPYAVYVGLSAAARYTKDELFDGIEAAAEADLAIKSSANGQLVLERLLLGVVPPRQPGRAA